MVETYRLSGGARFTNAVFSTLARFALGAAYRHILTVPGRKTRRPYSTPVDVLKVGGDRWLVARHALVTDVRA